MTRLKNWFDMKKEAVSAWKSRIPRLEHYIAIIRGSANHEKIGFYVGRLSDIKRLDKRYVATVLEQYNPKRHKHTKDAKSKKD